MKPVYFQTPTITLLLIIAFLTSQLKAQSKKDYLKNNRFDLNDNSFNFPQTDFKIIGFGAFHGSVKTENVELQLIKSLTKKGAIKYYLPETDFSIAYYFDKFLKNGDTLLLKDLVKHYGTIVPQERTVEVYKKWKKLKTLNDKLSDSDKLKVIGIDNIVSYKYTAKHILDLFNRKKTKLKPVEEVRKMVDLDTTSYAANPSSFAYKTLKKLVADYDINTEKYHKHLKAIDDFKHIINNLKFSFDDSKHREPIITENYLHLSSKYDFKSKPQFLRMGFFHIEKSREGKKAYPPFFTRLIENNTYTKEDIITVMGYLTNSEVIWEEIYDNSGNYKSYTIEVAGYGIGDYDKEYFRGIQNLKDSKISDMTLFRLNKKETPYSNKEPDLIEVIMSDKKSTGENLKNMSTTDFIDYAVLISDSKASTPIYEMD